MYTCSMGANAIHGGGVIGEGGCMVGGDAV